jgi:hypothetical protein
MLVTVIVVLVAIVVLMTIAGWLLPVSHVASATAVLAKPPDQVYTIVSDVSAYPKWWSGDPGVKTDVVEARRPTRFVSRIADPDEAFGGTWTFDITPDGPGSRLTITERGEVYNPFFRFMARFVFGYTGTMESFLAALQQAP